MLYSSLPIITFDNVDFPVPLGPIIACTSPSIIERLKSSNIFLSPATAVSFLTSSIITPPNT